MNTPTSATSPPHLRTIFARAMREQRGGLIGWASGLVVFCVVMLAMYPTIHANANFSELINAYPEPLRKLFQLEDYTTGAGYLRTEVFSFVVPLLLTLFAVLWGSDLVAGEEERRTVDSLLANPVSRQRVVVEKWFALLVGLSLLSILIEGTLGLLGPLFELHVAWARLSAALVGSWLFAVVFGTFALALGAATGRRGLSRGVATTLALTSYLVATMATLVSWLRPVRNLSLWQHTMGLDPLGTGFHLWRLGIVVLVSALFVAWALWSYDRRDLAT